MNHLQFGDSIIVYNPTSLYHGSLGTIQSIDIYGNVEVQLESNVHGTFRREDLKLFQKRGHITPYLDHNPRFLNFFASKYRSNKSRVYLSFDVVHIRQLIDVALDTRDREWFFELVDHLHALQKEKESKKST